MVKKILGQCYIWLIMIFMYAPVMLLVVFSFTNSKIIGANQWNGFTFQLYADLWHEEELLRALGNTIIIAICAAIVSTVLGTMGAIGAFYSKRKMRKSIDSVTQIPIANAEIVMALSLTLLFVFVGQKIIGHDILGFWTLLIGHTVLAVPFVYTSVKPKLEQMDQSLYEAAIDLGCTPRQALNKVIIPEVMPGIMSGFFLSITLSLDDVVITEFTRGPGLLSEPGSIETLSTYIQSVIKRSAIPPAARALVSLIFLSVVIGVAVVTIVKSNKASKLVARKGHFHG